MKKLILISGLLLMASYAWSVKADPELLQQLLAAGDTARYEELLTMERATMAHTAEMLHAGGAKRVSSEWGGAAEPNLAPRGLLILVEFTDVKFSKLDYASADSMLNAANYHYDGAVGSAKEYFREQSGGQYVPDFTVVGPVTLAHDHDYYGTNTGSGNYSGDAWLGDLVAEGAILADRAGIDFSDYDNDNDEVVDFIYYIFAGTGEAESGISTDIWPNSGSLYSLCWLKRCSMGYNYRNPLVIDGKVVDRYACSNELSKQMFTYRRCGLGTFLHEYSHVVGLPDIYDTNYGPNYQQGLTPGSWHLMDGGSYNNRGITPPNYAAWDKFFCGWVTPAPLSGERDFRLETGEVAYLRTGSDKRVTPSTRDSVFYLEYRQKQGWDAYLPGEGLVTWRVDYDEYGWESNQVNASDASTSNLLYVLKDQQAYPTSKGVDRFSVGSEYALTRITDEDGSVVFRLNGGDGTMTDDCLPYTWMASAALAEGTNIMGRLAWEVNSGLETTYGYNVFVGATFGTDAAPTTMVELTTSEVAACAMDSLTIEARGADATLRVHTGQTDWGTATLSAGNGTYTFVNSSQAEGPIQISISGATGRVGIRRIELGWRTQAEGIENPVSSGHEKATKAIMGGRLMIIRGEAAYNVLGLQQ